MLLKVTNLFHSFHQDVGHELYLYTYKITITYYCRASTALNRDQLTDSVIELE